MKFWQMVGRGTRLCPNLFGPDKHKTEFYIFDFCGNLEFFSANPETADGSAAESLGKRLFKARLELVGVLDKKRDIVIDAGLRDETAEHLRGEVAAMNLDNFVVRPKRKLVEEYAKAEAWVSLTEEARYALATEVAGLPTELEAEAEEAKRFDLLMLRLQLAVLLAEPSFERLRDQVKEIAGLLEEKQSIPMVRAQLPLILDLQSDEWWQDVTAPMLEGVRKKLRDLVQFIDKAHRKPIFTVLDDVIGEGQVIALPGFGTAGGDFEKFRQKARAFLRQHTDNSTMRRLRWGERLSPGDLQELELLLAQCGGSPEEIAKVKTEGNGLALFVRTLVGLDREAAKRALATFLTGTNHTANQIEFVNLVIDHLTEHGTLDAGVLYESPVTDISPRGPDGLFSTEELQLLVGILSEIQTSATAV